MMPLGSNLVSAIVDIVRKAYVRGSVPIARVWRRARKATGATLAEIEPIVSETLARLDAARMVELGFQAKIHQLEPGATIVDTLIRTGEEAGDYRIIRTHVMEGMSFEDVQANIQRVLDHWNRLYRGQEAVIVSTVYRVR